MYQWRALRRLAGNPNLASNHRGAAQEQAAFIRGLLRAHPLLDDLSRCIEDTGNRVLLPLLLNLRDQAQARLRQAPDTTARDVLMIFAGELSWFEKRYVERMTVRAVLDRCTAFRCLAAG